MINERVMKQQEELKSLSGLLGKTFNKDFEPKPQTIYCGTFDQVEFFAQIISTLGLDIDYQVKVVDGEYEIEIATSEE